MVGGLIDMARSESEQTEAMPLAKEDKYPYGLRINLGTEELERLGVDHSDWEIGDVFPLDILAKVVSKSANETEGGHANCNISLQITHIGAEEEEPEEEQPLKKHGYLLSD